MAKPIHLGTPPRDARAELVTRLESAPVEHAEALLAGYELLQKLHDRGVLDLACGLVGSTDKVLRSLVDAALSPGSVRAVRNSISIASFMAELDPDLFSGFLHGLAQALNRAKEQEKKPPGFLGLLKHLRSEDLRRGLALVNGLLEAWGKPQPPGESKSAANS
ncbi:MAG: DUF1641 domain-containing protein [Terriglobia bacterium]